MLPGVVLAQVDEVIHEFTTAQVHNFHAEYGDDYSLPNPQGQCSKIICYATGLQDLLASKKKQTLRDLQVSFQHTGVRDYSAVNGVPGNLSQVAREEFIDVIFTTDSHTAWEVPVML